MNVNAEKPEIAFRKPWHMQSKQTGLQSDGFVDAYCTLIAVPPYRFTLSTALIVKSVTNKHVLILLNSKLHKLDCDWFIIIY